MFHIDFWFYRQEKICYVVIMTKYSDLHSVITGLKITFYREIRLNTNNFPAFKGRRSCAIKYNKWHTEPGHKRWLTSDLLLYLKEIERHRDSETPLPLLPSLSPFPSSVLAQTTAPCDCPLSLPGPRLQDLLWASLTTSNTLAYSKSRLIFGAAIYLSNVNRVLRHGPWIGLWLAKSLKKKCNWGILLNRADSWWT